jgi:phosphoglycolate phosphatase-like HAD superfamily hydrolase
MQWAGAALRRAWRPHKMVRSRSTIRPSTATRAARNPARAAHGNGNPTAAAGPLAASRVVFADIGDILGQPVFSTVPPPQLERLDVFPFVGIVLRALKADGLRLGVISNTGDEPKARMDAVLKAAGLFDLFEPELLIYSSDVGLTKNSPEIFQLAAERAGLAANPDACLFVGENPRERSFAAQAGFRVARDLSLLEPVLLAATAVTPVLTGLGACLDDVVLAALDTDDGPPDPLDFASLLGRLETSRERLPPLYRQTVHAPFVAALRALGAARFAQVLISDPRRERLGGLMLDIAHAILQNGERFNDTATDAFEEVVSDLYDGFLSAEDRKGIELPETVVVPPLVKWGNPDFGPYTWPLDATRNFDVGATIVSLPPSNARAGLMAWAALAHETAGHDILSANDGLADELSRSVLRELTQARIGFGLAEYWSQRIDETASDVMGILNMGPAAAIGVIAYFRGLSVASGGPPQLRAVGPNDDPHPADILRGYLGAATVALLSFNGASQWANVIEKQTDRDLEPIVLGDILVSPEVAKQSAVIVAGAIATRKLAALGDHRLIDIQDWRDRDEARVTLLRKLLTTNDAVPVDLVEGVFAAHVVAAAVTGALASDANPRVLFTRMISILKGMHDSNPSWGPLFVSSPSSIARHFAVKPTSAVAAALRFGMQPVVRARP